MSLQELVIQKQLDYLETLVPTTHITRQIALLRKKLTVLQQETITLALQED